MNSPADWITWALYVVTALFVTHRIAVSSAMPGRKLLYVLVAAVVLSVLFGVARGAGFLVLCPLLLMLYPGSRPTEWFKAFRLISAGRAFGNEIADSMLMSRNMFHNAIEAGGVPMHLMMLAQIKFSGASVMQAKKAVAPILMTGLQVLEQRFGPQAPIAKSSALLKELYPNCDADGAHMEAMVEMASLIRSE